jgi:hypothetical protein
MSESGTMPKQDIVQKIFRDLIMQKQNEILNQTNIDKRKQLREAMERQKTAKDNTGNEVTDRLKSMRTTVQSQNQP